MAELTLEALARCRAIGHGALEVAEALRAEVGKSPALGRQARGAVGGMKLYTTRVEAANAGPALTVTYVHDAPPPAPGPIRIALVPPVRFADGDAGL
ncbi:hypothetical protein GQF42_19440 [Streptomyces broussonetiae]|uniref:Uncharacterized protein n=1 Tax=Streptomyces broussonetiae TaxID=2686304 RepID=A0A6I6NAD5_9ACTN|nr:hypothetical protein [Streptomyces broussonetiae]QHA05177.1 hypothetical protein GQF42_19440 [Streptomyces broussonetiae]